MNPWKLYGLAALIFAAGMAVGALLAGSRTTSVDWRRAARSSVEVKMFCNHAATPSRRAECMAAVRHEDLQRESRTDTETDSKTSNQILEEYFGGAQ